MAGADTSGKVPGRPFQKGQSGNPSGRPKAHRDYLRKLLGENGEKAFDMLWDVATQKPPTREELRERQRLEAEGEDLPVLQVPSIRERMDAARVLLEYLVGKPAQELEVTGKDGGPIEAQTDVKHEHPISAEQLGGVLEALSRSGAVAELLRARALAQNAEAPVEQVPPARGGG